MSHHELVSKFRDRIIAPDGSITSTPGDKIFIKLTLDPKQAPCDLTNFKVWVKGRVTKVYHDSVQIEDVLVVNKFEDDSKQKVCDDNFDNIKKRFRGSKSIVLKKDESWIIVPSDLKTGISAFFQEQISPALGLTANTTEDSQEPIQPERMNNDVLVRVINTKMVLGKEQQQQWNSIFMLMFSDYAFTVTPAKQLVLFFKPKEPWNEEVEQILYSVNIFQEFLGMSIIKDTENRQAFESNWKKMDKETATTFRFIYSGLCDRLDASKESVQEMFPQDGKLQELTSKLKKCLDRIN